MHYNTYLHIRMFQLTVHKKADRSLIIPHSAAMYFNSQPHEEADGTLDISAVAQNAFQLTASR